MRLFIAVNFPPPLREALYSATAPLRAAAPGVRWTHPERLHLTVKFLGAQPPELEAALRVAMDKIATRHHAMELVLTGIGAFPSLRRPRVVWIGIEHASALEQLARDMDTACALLGVPREERPFRPHLTLGRVRPGTRPAALHALVPAAESLYVHAVASADTLDLMESRADRGGHHYIVLHRAPLGAP